MNDSEFLKAFEACTLHDFPHQSHIRMAWLYLRAEGLEAGTVKIREGIQRFANSLSATNKYHETITVFWARVVYQAITQTPDISDFDEFVERHPRLLDKRLISQYYSADVISSPLARQQWVEPDLKPLTISV